MMYILILLGVLLILTPTYHPEIAGRSVEYALEYSKLRFHQYFNNAVAENLNANLLTSLEREVLNINRVSKLGRKARECKLSYSLMFDMVDGEEEATRKAILNISRRCSKYINRQWIPIAASLPVLS